jgi:hypothetical protein
VNNRVEIAFDLSADPNADFAVLDDPVKGVLGSTTYVLGGQLLIDVTDSVLGYSIVRGKSRQLDRYPAGSLTVNLNNNQRIFDPLYTEGPYFGQIVPRRDVRVTSNDVLQYRGTIDDWNLDYQPQGNSIASIVASDGLTKLANQTLTGGTATAQLTSERISAVLNDVSVNWPLDRRSIEEGLQTLQADVIEANTNALEYMQLVTDSEPGSMFIAKDGSLVFKNRHTDESSAETVTFADDGSGIGYQGLNVVYGAELLYNEVVVSRLNGGTVVASNLPSQADYGISTLTLENLLMDSDADAEALAQFLVGKYAQPEYRFESVDIDLVSLTEADQNEVLGLELGAVVLVKFTPNGISPAIERYAEVIRIDQRVGAQSHRVTLGLGALDYSFFRLSDSVFGRLSAGNSLAY